MACVPTASLGMFAPGPTSISILLWQYLGVLMMVAGVGCLFASRSPFRQPLFLVLFAAAMLSLATGSLVSATGRSLPLDLILIGVLWGLVLAFPTIWIVWESVRSSHALGSAFLEPEADDPLCELHTNTGQTLDELADEKPQLIVFLRHAGCTFCRQALSDIQSTRKEIEETGCGILLVHLGKENDPESLEVFDKYGVADLPRISDPTSRLYRQFGLDLGGFSQLFGLRVWLRGFVYGVVNGHGVGAVRGNSFQMPGVYLYHCGIVLGGFRHELASDRPNYVALARQIQNISDSSALQKRSFATS